MARIDAYYRPSLIDSDPTAGSCRPLRWGIVGPGNVAQLVCEDLALIPSAVIAAVSGQRRGRAEQFAARNAIGRVYDDHVQLVADPSIDVVYVASPHASHFEVVRDALLAGKHVLCEKPLTLTRAAAVELFDLAAARSLFMMEAIWSRFLPATQMALAPIAAGGLGEVRWVHADLGFTFPRDDGPKWDLAAGGGALSEIGAYTVGWAQLLMGDDAVATSASAELTERGVDGMTVANFSHEGAVVRTVSAIDRDTPGTLIISGTEGHVRIAHDQHNAREVEVFLDGDFQSLRAPRVGRGYSYELREVTDCIAAGRTESDLMPASDSIGLLALMERARRLTGVTLPAGVDDGAP
jgi:predicted dehydrogenase